MIAISATITTSAQPWVEQAEVKYRIDTTYYFGKNNLRPGTPGYNPVYHTAERVTLKALADYVFNTHAYDSANFGGLSQNIANANLTATASHTHNWSNYGSLFRNVRYWNIMDTMGFYLISMNDPAPGSTPLITITHTPVVRKFQVAANVGVNNLIVDSAANNTTVTHFGGNSGAPSIAAGAGAGTGPTVSVGSGSTDLSGYINVTTGTTPSTSATVVTLTFVSAYSAAPRCILIRAANSATAVAIGAQQVFVDQAGITTTTFDLTSGTTALAGSTTYKWYYVILQ